MASDATSGRGLAERKLYVATKLAGQLVDHLDRLAQELRGELSGSREQLCGQVDDLVVLATVLHDELREVEVL